MSDHEWEGECPYCGFQEIIVRTGNHYNYAQYYFEIFCPICGFARWTDGKDPENADMDWAKRKLKEMSPEEIAQVIASSEEDGLSLAERYRNER